MATEHRAEVVLTGGRIWTGIERRRPEDTVAVRDGRIVAVGPYDELAWAIGPRTRVIPLAGRLLVPAFQDAHVHPILAGLAMERCDLSGLVDLEACLDAVAAWARAHPDAPWILGEGWIPGAFPGGPPRATDLDRVVADRPALLDAYDGHSSWANSAALELAGIRAETPDPDGGRIERASDGSPIGTLVERAMALVADLAPPPGPAELEVALERGQAHLHGLGIGGWHDAHVTPEREAAYLALAERGQLHGQVSVSLLWDERRWLEQIPELVARRERIAERSGGLVRAPSVKLFQDGVVETATAALVDPYLDARGRASQARGDSLYAPEVLRDMCVALDRERFSLHVHAIGDRAVRETLDALTVARKANGPRDARHTIAHLQLVHRSDRVRFAALGVVANCQPLWAVDDPLTRATTRPLLGAERTAAMYPFGSLLRTGAQLALGSDWNVTTADPLRIMDAAITRLDHDTPGAKPLGPVSERLKPEAALRAYTRGSAFVGWCEDVSGTIEVGKSADLVLLASDPFATAGSSWRDATVLMTMTGGRIVHEHPDLGG